MTEPFFHNIRCRFSCFTVVICICFVFACNDDEHNPTPSKTAMIAAYNSPSRDAALEVFAMGGHAVDAFVAATFVDYVVAPGVTSMAGLIGALVYDAESGETTYLDAGFNTFADPESLWEDEDPVAGRAVLVPGAVRGLEALWKRYGRLAWADLLEPARRLAANGFVLDSFYADRMIPYYAATLQVTEYGRRTFFPNGTALQTGDTLRQPELAAFIAALQEQGADAMYNGTWADDMVALVNATGGRATTQDLQDYAVSWNEPWTIDYRGFDVHACSGRNLGGLAGLIGLKALAYGDTVAEATTDADQYERRIRIARTLYQESWLSSPELLENASFVEERLSETYAEQLWDKATGQLDTPINGFGSHSYHVIAVDQDGNAITGTNSIFGPIWGEGLFVQGVPLTAGGMYTSLIPGPGQRTVLELSMHMAFRDNTLRMVSGAFGHSLMEAEFQFLIHVLRDGLDAGAAIVKPRFGSFPFNGGDPTAKDWSANWVDTAFPLDLLTELEGRGLRFDSGDSGLYCDTGYGGIITYKSGGSVEGATVDIPLIDDGVATFK